MSWWNPWRHAPIPPPKDLATLSKEELDLEQTRANIEKTRIEILDERSWCAKLLLSLILPIGAAFAFCTGWWKDHASDRDHRETQSFADAAQQLDSPSDTVRLNAIHTLDENAHNRSWLGLRIAAPKPADCTRSEDNPRARQSVALIIGRLNLEQEAAVLDAISAVAVEHPCLTLGPLLSIDRSAAVKFARAAGDFTATYLLHKMNATHLDQGGGGPNALSQDYDGTLSALDAITSRSGSPFEATDALNEVFISAPLVTTGTICPFGELYNKQFELTASSKLNSPLLAKPPSEADVVTSMTHLQTSAALLEKASYVLGSIASSKPSSARPASGIDLIRQHLAQEPRANLLGVAIVVGELDDSVVKNLQSLGAFVQRPEITNTCPLPQTPHP